MALSDPIADMLTRIRNALRGRKKTVNCSSSKVCRGIAEVLKAEGFIEGYDHIDDGKQGVLRVHLKYGPHGETLLNRLQRESKPGRRVYRGASELPRPMQGLGIAIVSTSKGVMSDRRARQERVGGEVLCTVE